MPTNGIGRIGDKSPRPSSSALSRSSLSDGDGRVHSSSVRVEWFYLYYIILQLLPFGPSGHKQ